MLILPSRSLVKARSYKIGQMIWFYPTSIILQLWDILGFSENIKELWKSKELVLKKKH